VVVCLERGADLHMAQLMPLPLTFYCFSEIEIGFIFLVPAHPGSPRKRVVKQVCVCVCVRSAVATMWPFIVLQELATCAAPPRLLSPASASSHSYSLRPYAPQQKTPIVCLIWQTVTLLYACCFTSHIDTY